MKTYPTDVRQNFNVQGAGPASWGPVANENWKMFAPLADAQAGMGMIEGVTDEAVMVDAKVLGGMYAQFDYLAPLTSDIRARVVVGQVSDSQGQMGILEYPSDIFDRDKTPTPFIDTYTAGSAHVLKVRRITSDLGELYWAAA